MWCGTQATHNVIREVIGTRGGHMFLILAGAVALCLVEEGFTIFKYRGQSLGQTRMHRHHRNLSECLRNRKLTPDVA